MGADGKIAQVGFDGKGCAICIACSSMMTEAVKGKTLEEAEQIAALFKKMMRNEAPFQVFENVPDMEALSGVRKFSVRVKCATLAWTTLRNGILQYEAARGTDRGTGIPVTDQTQEGRAKARTKLRKRGRITNRPSMTARPGCASRAPPARPEAARMAALPAAKSRARAPNPAAGAAASARVSARVEELRDALKDVFDPEIPINIVDLGLVYKLEEKDGQVNLEMTLTTPLCPFAGQIKAPSPGAAGVTGVKSVNVNLVFDPPWSKERMTL